MAGQPHPDYTEHRLTSKLVYDGKLLKVREDSVRLPDGKTARSALVRIEIARE